MRHHRKHSYVKHISLCFLAILIIAGLVAVWWWHGTSPANAQDATPQNFTIQKGESLKQIAADLQQKGLINDGFVFSFMVKQMNLANNLQSGEFKLSPNMSAQEIAMTLEKGTIDEWVTIPDGKRADEIAEILQQQFPQYTSDWKTTLEQQEGFLFPDTYRFPKDVTIDQIIQTLKNNFNQKFDSIPTNPNNQYTLNQIVTVASLVSREAKYPDDQVKVASVIYNRLKIGMPLDIDSTIQYALGYQPKEKTWWKSDLSTTDLQIDSPYNSYTHTGLPPTPIANPGESALAAAIHPEQTNYYYYLSDNLGHLHYAITNDQHEENIKKYLQ